MVPAESSISLKFLRFGISAFNFKDNYQKADDTFKANCEQATVAGSHDDANGEMRGEGNANHSAMESDEPLVYTTNP